MDVRLGQLQKSLEQGNSSGITKAACAYVAELDSIILSREALQRSPSNDKQRRGEGSVHRNIIECGQGTGVVTACASAAIWVSTASTVSTSSSDAGLVGLIDEYEHVSTLVRAARALANEGEHREMLDRLDTWLARYLPGSGASDHVKESKQQHKTRWFAIRFARVLLQL
jgi:hypothetical protein